MRLFVILLLCICFRHLPAQVTINEFLYDTEQEPLIKSFDARTDYLSNKKTYRLAPIQKLELRTESNQLDRTRQEYGLRLNPANPFEIKRTNQYFRSYQELLKLDRERTLKELLFIRYEVVIGWIYYQEIRDLKLEDKTTTEKLLGILEGQRYSGLFDAEDYVELKMDQVDKITELEETMFEIDNQKRLVETLYTEARQKNINWPVADIISVDRLERVVDSIYQSEVRAGEVAYHQKQIEMAMHEWYLEKANISMGFIQTSYQKWRIEQNQRPWSISLGITIPLFNPNKEDMTKRKLDMLEAEGEFNTAKNDQQAGLEISREKIKSLSKRFREIQLMTDQVTTGSVSNTLQQIKDSNPVAVIRMQNKAIKLKTMAARLRQEIYLGYIEFLGFAEVLQQPPLRNFLDPNLKPVAP
ncbi:MAG: hypothetical protein DYG99_12050 [Bacteroidetes bacterium CHB5]|nr:hypothetical protein [Bacteroidetes bacterium CHB5]